MQKCNLQIIFTKQKRNTNRLHKNQSFFREKRERERDREREREAKKLQKCSLQIILENEKEHEQKSNLFARRIEEEKEFIKNKNGRGNTRETRTNARIREEKNKNLLHTSYSNTLMASLELLPPPRVLRTLPSSLSIQNDVCQRKWKRHGRQNKDFSGGRGEGSKIKKQN